MTATLHIGRRTTPHHPRPSLRERWSTFILRHSRRAQTAFFAELHDALPLDDPDRHALDAPALEAAFAQLAADHPEPLPADTGQAARDADREVLLLAVCDRWFRDAHAGPQHRWSPATVAAYQRLMDDVRDCFHPGGET
ncbi:hypothetical protein [Streptomyces sp. Amel2xC10]|uniref:hypothetical protein n=1 Tax=Streptomyces sp. Amel2xC10 TaxID=1305826 RepID=UPI000A08BB18|nr:hypothetical protein [Streptomyces sp. Amel2xC10]SMF86002.1 hypothetical protein SAMN02745830_07102 [Streptomyces sp. Amel2xC10]